MHLILLLVGLLVIVFLIYAGNDLLFSWLRDGLQRRAVERDQRHRQG